MTMLYFTCFLISIPYVVATGIIFNKDPSINVGGQLMNYVKFNESERIKTCEFEYRYSNGTKNSLLLNIESTSKIYDSMVFSDRLYNIGRGLCGVKMMNLTLNDPKYFSLIVLSTSDTKKIYYNFSISFYELNAFHDETYYVQLGGKQVIGCGVISQVSCRLYNPKGELAMDGKVCHLYTIDFITIEDIGRWRCEIVIKYQMEIAIENFDLKLRTDIFRVDTWYKEKDGLGMVGCKYIKDGYKNTPTVCVLVAPNNKYFIIKTGRLTSRYTTIGTNLTDFTCQMEMPLPLLESEKGNWKCKIHESGGYINVGNFSSLPRYSVRKEATAIRNEPLTIRCQVPYRTDNCVLKAPNGTIYFSDKSLGMGICSKSFEKADVNLTGTWHCHISNPRKSADDTITVETYWSSSVKSLTSNIEVYEGQSTELFCNRSIPIRSCRFIDPQGITYHLSPKKTDSVIKYAGRGFEFGDCGINIINVVANQDGKWTCLVQGVNTDELEMEFNSTIKLAVYGERLSLGSSIGIPIGISLASIVMLAFLIFILYKRHLKKQRNQRRPSQTSNASTTSNAILDVSNVRRYDENMREMTTFF